MGRIRAIFEIRIWGYSLRRWTATCIVGALILLHALGSSFWYRIATGTYAKNHATVLERDLRFGNTAALQNKYSYGIDENQTARRQLQAALDAERAGSERVDGRGTLILPPPTVFIQTGTRDALAEPIGHVFQCSFTREDCAVMLQSDRYFVQIIRGTKFITRMLIDRPALIIRQMTNGVNVNVLNLERRYLRGLEIYLSPIERIEPSFEEIVTSNGDALVQEHLGLPSIIFSETRGIPLSTQDFAPFDVMYTTDFSQSETYVLSRCQEDKLRVQQLSVPNASSQISDCIIDPNDIEVFSLTECHANLGNCPSRASEASDDLQNQQFTKVGRAQTVSLGFLDADYQGIFAIADRILDEAPDSGLIDLPGRNEIVEAILLDYLTILGFSASTDEFVQFLAANPEVNMQDLIQTFQNVSPTIVEGGVKSALRRQPQLWAWHGYAHQLQPELLNNLARDLVRMGLANPY